MENNEKEKTKKINSKMIFGIIGAVIVLILVFMAGRMSSDDYYDEEENYGLTNNNYYQNEATEDDENKAKPKTSSKTTKANIIGTYYNPISLVDYQSNVEVFKGLAPEGWTGSVSSNYQVISPDYPVLESVTLTSPDGKATIYIDSQQQYCESSSMGEGVSEEYYTTYLHYMDADEFIQYFMDYAHPGSTLTKTLENDEELLNQAKQYQQLKVEKSKSNFQSILGSSYGSYSYNVTPGTTTMSRKQYQTPNSYLEGSCVIIPITTTLSSQYYSLTNNYWEIPYSIVFEAVDKEAFDKYYDDYNFIIANSQFTPDCYALIEYVSSCIQNVKSAQAAAKSQASLNAMNDYIDSNYSSTSSESTNEKVMGMWDDYINEVDSYNTLDGGTIKTSMYNDIVAQDGDKIFVGSSTSDIPAGFTQLEKSY